VLLRSVASIEGRRTDGRSVGRRRFGLHVFVRPRIRDSPVLVGFALPPVGAGANLDKAMGMFHAVNSLVVTRNL
jgi:hypothetical protein